MRLHPSPIVPLVVLCACACGIANADESRLLVPEGFRVTLYAPDELAHNIYCMTIDAAGRVVVSGPGYVKLLHDDDGDGRADRATTFCDYPGSGAHGLVFDGPHLICNGDNGLRRLVDADGDGRADGPKETWARLAHPEHGANGLVQGPDGWFYLICGNNAGVSREHVQLPSSPVTDPYCGAVVRFSPDGRRSDVYAHGFRNPYDLDFSPTGQLYTVDSDGERDHHLPWYAPTRLFDIGQGREHGWLLEGWIRSWNRPEWFYDNVERSTEFGRGSPTGLVVYRHRQFPERYRGGIFCACWTLGRIYFCPLQRDGATFRSAHEVFLQSTGDAGFAPVDLAVGPQGDLFVAVGGRGTRGSVYRIRYAAGEVAPLPDDPLQRVLAADQPLSAWSRSAWVPAARRLGRDALQRAACDATLPVAQRVRAIEILVELFGGPAAPVARRLAGDAAADVAARLAWALGRMAASEQSTASWAVELLARATRHDDALVRRAAWEALAECDPQAVAASVPQPEWLAAAADPLRRVRWAMLHAACRQTGDVLAAATRGGPQPPDEPRLQAARLWLALLRDQQPDAAFGRAAWRVLDAAEGTALRLEAVRLLQRGLGDARIEPGQPEVYSGYTARSPQHADDALRAELAAAVLRLFPSDDRALDYELARLCAMLGGEFPGLLDRLATRWTAQSDPHDDIHYLIVASRLSGPRPEAFTRRCAEALLGLHPKMQQRRWYPSRNWPARLGEAVVELLRRDAALAGAIVDSPGFGHAEHALLAALLPDEQRRAAAHKLLERTADADPEDGLWHPTLVRAVSVLENERVFPVLRRWWDDPSLQDDIVKVLARAPEEIDRPRFLAALASSQTDVVQEAAAALGRLAPAEKPEELAAVLRALRQACTLRELRATRAALVALLQRWTGRTLPVHEDGENLLAGYQAWFDDFAVHHPQHARLLGGAAATWDAWQQRLAEVDWASGDPARGRAVYQRKACARCHEGSSRLGPELRGVANRFSRDDLFAALIDPNREVAPPYRTVVVTTRSGKIYHGILVYESPNSSLLQVSADQTVRITGEELLSMQPSNRSLMPEGLLNDATDQDLADLYAYLRQLTQVR
jgi:putative membrane-bound dehydrogenase-like protein